MDTTAPSARPPHPRPAAREVRRAPGAGAVLRAVLDHGPVARSTVARLTGLSPASVTGHCARLLDRGLIRQAPETAGPRGLGRPHVPMEIERDGPLAAGAHIGVACSTLSLTDLRGRVVWQERLPHPQAPGRTPERVLELLAAHIPELVDRHADGRRVTALGVATGHRVDPAAGVVLDHPLLGWQDVPVRARLEAASGLPVEVDSHARALTRAEQLFGEPAVRTAARASAVVLFVGAVVDAAFSTGAAVHEGPRAGAGGVAHLPVGVERGETPMRCVCGGYGCLSAEASERAMLGRAAAAGLPVPSFRALLDAALAGEPRALALFLRRARLAGRAAALLIDLFDPAVLVVVEPGSCRLPRCLGALRREAVRCSRSLGPADAEDVVVPSSFPRSVLATAGSAVALHALYTDPLKQLPNTRT
ncbi:ROK family protein [Streptomyces montanisoli]|uniref:ROK family transcriptional regulator n=1 Tax=Streptomyces montanisoli TaxID=2798581 RepID=A0A940MDI9_9ACTN|nr:ROK family transcriptional regulator [Streptomyces montanisoli]